MKKYMIAATVSVVGLAGCSTAGEYYKSVDSTNARNAEIAIATAKADEARYNALAMIASSGDSTAKVAATMALALGATRQVQQAAVAQPMQSEALQWASILVPGVTQGLSIYYNTKATMNASNNATALGMNTNQTFGVMAGEINSPVVVTQPAPTIVTQPAPTIVTQPAPIIVDPIIVNPVVVQP
jgi:hypothetical protein